MQQLKEGVHLAEVALAEGDSKKAFELVSRARGAAKAVGLDPETISRPVLDEANSAEAARNAKEAVALLPYIEKYEASKIQYRERVSASLSHAEKAGQVAPFSAQIGREILRAEALKSRIRGD